MLIAEIGGIIFSEERKCPFNLRVNEYPMPGFTTAVVHNCKEMQDLVDMVKIHLVNTPYGTRWLQISKNFMMEMRYCPFCGKKFEGRRVNEIAPEEEKAK